MIDPFFPPPSIDPKQRLSSLERIRAYDGLVLNAQTWSKAHQYHRQRQNIYYQSLYQPGIVYGLGISIIDAPKEVSAKYRALPWVKIHPGIAIDWEGNPIVVPKEVTFPLNPPQNLTKSPLTVYLLISYRDPETLNQKNASDTIQETFRLDQKTSFPASGDVELCRIQWQPGNDRICVPQNVLSPKINQLDLRYRLQAQARPQATLNIGTTENLPRSTRQNLSCLMASVSALYPTWQGVEEISSVLIRSLAAIASYDLFYLCQNDIENLNEKEFSILDEYLQIGGTIAIEVSTADRSIESTGDLVAKKLNRQEIDWHKSLDREHPLRRKPFLFVALPEINGYSIELWHDGGGIILLESDLSAAWGFNEELFLSRNDIRTAQEFGINLLHFSWHRRRLTQLTQ